MAIKIDSKKFFEVSLIAFLVIEGLSWLLSQFDIGVPFLKGGFLLVLFLLVILLITLLNFGMNLTSLKLKDFVFMILVFALVIGLYLILPLVIPQIYSILPGESINYEVRNFFGKTFGSVAGIGTGVV